MGARGAREGDSLGWLNPAAWCLPLVLYLHIWNPSYPQNPIMDANPQPCTPCTPCALAQGSITLNLSNLISTELVQLLLTYFVGCFLHSFHWFQMQAWKFTVIDELSFFFFLTRAAFNSSHALKIWVGGEKQQGINTLLGWMTSLSPKCENWDWKHLQIKRHPFFFSSPAQKKQKKTVIVSEMVTMPENKLSF